MTGRHKRKIEKVEGDLTPSELFSLWLTNLQQFNSPAEYTQSALGADESGSARGFRHCPGRERSGAGRAGLAECGTAETLSG